jgi:hypothetical protein
MIELKTLSAEAIPAALMKANRYRMLNDPDEAESICLDILAVEPDNQDALITMLLALTDKFSHDLTPSYQKAMDIINRLSNEYCTSYYHGIIFERRAKVHLKQGRPGSGQMAHHWFTKALGAYGEAINYCDPENHDAVLRWNSCARFINENTEVKPEAPETGEMPLDCFDTPH